VKLNSLQATILENLIEAQTPLTAGTLGDLLGHSTGVIRYNIPAIRQWLDAHDSALLSSPNVGFTIHSSDEQRQKLMYDLAFEDIEVVFSPSDRRNILLLELLFSLECRTLTELAKTLSVSRATLMRDLETVEQELAGHNLSLQKKPRLGTKITGQETELRQALLAMIIHKVPGYVLMKLCRWGLRDVSPRNAHRYPVQTLILDKISQWDLADAWRKVNRIESELSFSFGDKRHLFLVLYWAVMVYRYRGGFSISFSNDLLESILTTSEYRVVEDIAQRLFISEGVQIPEVELAHFTADIISSPREAYTEIGNIKARLEPIDTQAAGLANNLVNQIAHQTGYSLDNPVVLERMTNHISRTLFRLRYGLPIENPFTGDVMHSYPEIWKATREAVHQMEPEIGVLSDEEIAYLTMYMALAHQLGTLGSSKTIPRVIVVCPSGGITIWMLVSRLREEMPDLEIVDSISLRELAKVDLSLVDAIITTARNVQVKDIPVIFVSPLLTDTDVLAIRNRINLPQVY